MTTLTLPNEIINKIFSYIEGNNNQIIKKELIDINSIWGERNHNISTSNIKYALDLIKRNFIINQMLFNNKVIEYNKYFKYSILHNNRKFVSHHIKGVRNLINEYNYNDYYYNYTIILQEIRANYIIDYYYKYELTRKQLRKYHNVYFKYTFLHQNRKNVCNDIKKYNTKKHNIFDKKLSNKILLERGILFQQINTKR
jgi:hypothetical protein